MLASVEYKLSGTSTARGLGCRLSCVLDELSLSWSLQTEQHRRFDCAECASKSSILLASRGCFLENGDCGAPGNADNAVRGVHLFPRPQLAALTTL